MRLYAERPTATVDMAVDIVHRGLAAEVEWLRTTGHVIPSWQQRRWSRDLLAMHVYSYRAMDILVPDSFVRITSVA